MITKENCMAYILQNEPEFEQEYRKHLEYWDNQSKLNHDVAAFSHFVKDKLRGGDYDNAQKVFESVEYALTDGNADKEVQEAICTSFLENLLNFFTGDQEVLNRFVPFLGPKSREYCQAWDKFTGVITPGLHDRS